MSRQVREVTVKQALVVGLLLLLTVVICLARDLHPPAGIPVQVGLGSFQLSLIILSGALMLITLVVASGCNVFWRSFVSPPSYERSAWTTIRFCGLLPAIGAVPLLGFFLVSFYYFWADTQEPPLLQSVGDWVPTLAALLAVAEGIGLTRALILFVLAHTGKEDIFGRV